MCTKSQLTKITNRIVTYYRKLYGEDIVDILLYGSYARGDFTEDSDIDIVAVVRGERSELQEKLKYY